MKTKTFRHLVGDDNSSKISIVFTAERLDAEINEFMANHDVVDVQRQITTAKTETSDNTVLVITTITYR